MFSLRAGGFKDAFNWDKWQTDFFFFEVTSDLYLTEEQGRDDTSLNLEWEDLAVEMSWTNLSVKKKVKCFGPTTNFFPALFKVDNKIT